MLYQMYDRIASFSVAFITCRLSRESGNEAERDMLAYLESRYSDTFTILLTEEKIVGPDPIPSFR